MRTFKSSGIKHNTKFKSCDLLQTKIFSHLIGNLKISSFLFLKKKIVHIQNCFVRIKTFSVGHTC